MVSLFSTYHSLKLTAIHLMINRNVTNMPEKEQNTKGTLMLGYLEDGSSNEHLDISEQQTPLQSLDSEC